MYMIHKFYLNKADILKKVTMVGTKQTENPLNPTKLLMKDRHFIFRIEWCQMPATAACLSLRFF